MKQSPYTEAFYTAQRPDSELTAEIILSLLFPMLGTPRSVCDVGCGTGCWLKVAAELGADHILGFDGRWAGTSLVIPEASFQECDLNEFVHAKIRERFDLAICLETAEHLDQESAEPLVEMLTGLSDVVLFSAAIPGQGGTGHINEQWTAYWIKLFVDRDYAPYDVIRPVIWEDKRIPFWYRQNMLVFENTNPNADNEPCDFGETERGAMTVVHPELYMQRSGFFR